jgi:hypothetical protein
VRFRSDSQRRAVFANMNRFSYPSSNVLSTPPKYVYDGGYVNQFSNDSDLGDGSVKKVKRSEPHFIPDPGIYDDENHQIEVLRKGGIVYVTPPDSPEEFKRVQLEMMRKLDKKKFTTDDKKLKQANLSGEFLNEEIVAAKKLKEGQEPFKQVQTCFGDEYRSGRVKK